MRRDPVVTLPHARDARDAGRSELSDAAGLSFATGVYTGVVIGVAMWLGVIATCALLAALL